ncbi:DUF4245 domain-containing protein [Gephyromycinifex aptenodytis]|uniref:DUF4245 domain-containing protein n=1 Tax=Gephyromycinifex aptenodytis TaxID=2716227 RepID=UPI0014483B5C|nr:DUF4245 domain-containing protein [Gephyromycinifex aptenodytis]
MGTWRSLVISMLVMLGFVWLWLALSPRASHLEQREVDVMSVARQVNREAGLKVSVPQLQAPWTATSARYARSAEGLMTWYAGYHVTGDDSVFVGLRQTASDADPRAKDSWLAEATRDGREMGTVDIGGRTWTRHETGGEPVRRSLVSEEGGLLTVVEGLGPQERLTEFAGSLRPYKP